MDACRGCARGMFYLPWAQTHPICGNDDCYDADYKCEIVYKPA